MSEARYLTLRGVVMVAGGLAVVGNLYGWSVFGLGCEIGDTSGDWGRYCESVWMSAPPVGAASALLGCVIAWRTELRLLSVVLVVAGVALGLIPWIAFGDPAGNF